MRTMGAWMLAAGAAVALLSGCDDQNKQANTMETAPPQPAAQAPYPGDAGASHASYPQPQPAAQSMAMAPANEPLPEPEPVDTQVQPAPRNTARPAARPAPRESHARSSSSSSSGGRTYTVKKGDTLQEISQKFYGTTKNWRRIHTANRSAIGSNPDKLKVGTKLTIP